jgi:hypothetical protein
MIRLAAGLVALAALAACGPTGAPEVNKAGDNLSTEVETVDIPQTVTRLAPGTTPMAERVATLRLLNKRNGQWREFTLRPGQAARSGDVIVRLRACETAAPWEVQQLTGAFVQLDVRNREGRYQRVFSGWLYRETPSLNVIEHPIYDVWPMSCAMTHPGGEASGSPGGGPPSSRSSASNSAAPAPAPRPAPAVENRPSPAPPSADSNSTR